MSETTLFNPRNMQKVKEKKGKLTFLKYLTMRARKLL